MVHLTGGSRRAKLVSCEQAVSLFLQDFPSSKIERVVLSKDRHMAILQLANEEVIGLVTALGSKFITRRISEDMQVDVSQKSEDALVISLKDFTLPGLEFKLSNRDDLEEIQILNTYNRRDNRS